MATILKILSCLLRRSYLEVDKVAFTLQCLVAAIKALCIVKALFREGHFTLIPHFQEGSTAQCSQAETVRSNTETRDHLQQTFPLNSLSADYFFCKENRWVAGPIMFLLGGSSVVLHPNLANPSLCSLLKDEHSHSLYYAVSGPWLNICCTLGGLDN